MWFWADGGINEKNKHWSRNWLYRTQRWWVKYFWSSLKKIFLCWTMLFWLSWSRRGGQWGGTWELLPVMYPSNNWAQICASACIIKNIVLTVQLAMCYLIPAKTIAMCVYIRYVQTSGWTWTINNSQKCFRPELIRPCRACLPIRGREIISDTHTHTQRINILAGPALRAAPAKIIIVWKIFKVSKRWKK